MDHTGLSLGGFMQPSIARALIVYPPNVDKGLCQRFLWLAPEPTLTHFNDFQHVDKEFCASIGMIYFICVATMLQYLHTYFSEPVVNIMGFKQDRSKVDSPSSL